MTLRNGLDVPVVVRREGDAGDPVRTHERISATSTVLRLLAGSDELLMPGDVTRWPLGPAAATLTVVDLDATVAAIIDTLAPELPQLGSDDAEPEAYQGIAVVIRESAAAVAERAACVEGKNFLQAAACDVGTASTISRTLAGQLPRRQAAALLPAVLGARNWDHWARPSRTEDAGSGRVLALAAVPVPVVVAPPAPPAPAPVPAPAPAPVPAPAVPAPAAVPQPQPPASRTGGDLEAWIQAWLARLGSSDGTNDNGNGRGNGHGHGNGRGGD
jgi:hypothetical protein